MNKAATAIFTCSAVLLTASNAHADCQGFDGFGVIVGIQGSILTTHLAAFAVPAVVVAARKDDVNYWPGFGYVAAASNIAAVTTTAVAQIECEPLFTSVMPSVAGLGAGIVAGIVWGLTTEGEPKGGDFEYYDYSVTAVDVVPTDDRRGAVVTLSGTF